MGKVQGGAATQELGFAAAFAADIQEVFRPDQRNSTGRTALLRYLAFGQTESGLWVAAAQGLPAARRVPGVASDYLIRISNLAGVEGEGYEILGGSREIRYGSLYDPRTRGPGRTVIGFTHQEREAFLSIAPGTPDPENPARLIRVVAGTTLKEVVRIDWSLLAANGLPAELPNIAGFSGQMVELPSPVTPLGSTETFFRQGDPAA